MSFPTDPVYPSYPSLACMLEEFLQHLGEITRTFQNANLPELSPSEQAQRFAMLCETFWRAGTLAAAIQCVLLDRAAGQERLQ